MPDALRTATPMADWRSFKFTCEVTAGMTGIKEARAADVLGDRHSFLYQIEDTVGAVLESADFGDEAVLVYHAEKIMVPKTTGMGSAFLPGQRVYWDPSTRLVCSTFDSASLWIAIATEPAGINDLYVEIDLNGNHAEYEEVI